MNVGAQDLGSLCDQLVDRAMRVRPSLARSTGLERATALRSVAQSIRARSAEILQANRDDLARAGDLSPALRDRLLMDHDRLEQIAGAVESIADQPDPVGGVVDGRRLPNGIRLEKRRVPIGTILIIFESRPNVTVDAAALCLKSGNAVILRGGKEALLTNTQLAQAIRDPLSEHGLEDAVQLVPVTDRAVTTQLVRRRGGIDLCIPRGGPGLIEAITNEALIPVVKHDAGNCHLYIDEHIDGREEDAIAIACNAKAQRPGVCNAIETLLVHEASLTLLERLGPALLELGVELRADDACRVILPDAAPATTEDYGTEFLAPILAIACVRSLDAACAHIARFGSGHTEAIVTSSQRSAQRFLENVASANVMINCSTRFADGGQYGLGAEIGISTDKLHARGPMGAEDLTTYQWVLVGDGHTRS